MSPPSVEIEIFVLIDWAAIFQMFHCLMVIENACVDGADICNTKNTYVLV
jgi:hypothetical protein